MIRAKLQMCSYVALMAVLAFAAPGQAQRPGAYRYTGTPSAPQYALPVDVATIGNPEAVSNLTSLQTARLTENGFVVIPDEAIQMFYLYEDYPGYDSDDGPVPNFITVDSILHAYHLFFGFSLRQIESEYLVAACEQLSKTCAFHNDKFSKSLPEGALKEAARANVVYFSIAWSLATGQPMTQFLQENERSVFNHEMDAIQDAGGRAESPLMGTTIHYDQFRPRGHYTRTTELEQYFRAMIWYGTVGLELESDIPPAIVNRHQLQALLTTKILAGDNQARELWAKIYEPTQFFVGGSDDLGYRQYVPLAHELYGQALELSQLADQTRLEQFITTARRIMSKPQIAPFFHGADTEGNLVGEPGVQGRQFRFMGQRFIPDSYMLQALVSPLVRPVPENPRDARDMPFGLDVTAVLGSARAYHHLIDLYDQGRYPNYKEQMASLREQFFSYPEEKWWSNLYWGWLYSLQALLETWDPGYPTFMQTDAWLDKGLSTTLGSWAQLRHDTILYAKPSGAELGGAEPPAVRGYVEPVPEAWGRLAYLARLSRDGLQNRNLLSPAMAEAYAEFGNMLAFLKDCAEKELAGQPLSPDAYWRIQYFGGELERLQLSVVSSSDPEYPVDSWFMLQNETDRNVATVADVHTSFGTALEEAVGYAFRIYVVVPDPYDGLQVTKGGVFSYYEFGWPSSDRLTDEKWLQMLKDGEAPEQPEWTSSFIVP